MSTLIKNGLIVDPSDSWRGDIKVDGELIVAIGRDLGSDADTVIDADGKYVIPGGIDPHTHIESPFSGTVSCDTFTSATEAALAGGTTSLIDFCPQLPDHTFDASLEAWRAKLERSPSLIDVGCHFSVMDLEGGGGLEGLSKLADEGIRSLKLFMAYKGEAMVDDGTLFQTMKVAAANGSIVMVHAENGDVIDVLVREAVAAGKSEPKWHAETRPMATEAEATGRALMLAALADAPLYVVHVSCRDALDKVLHAQREGQRCWAETCTQYLFIDEGKLDAPDFEGAKYVFTPPPRPKEQLEEVWRGLERGELSLVSSDHAPFTWKDKKELGGEDFSLIPNGAPGIQERMQMLYTYGVLPGRISMNRFVEITSSNAAKVFGLYPKKGVLRPGSDADIVIWAPERTSTVSAESGYSRMDYSLYEGYEIRGGPADILVRGRLAFQDGEILLEPGYGKFMPR